MTLNEMKFLALLLSIQGLCLGFHISKPSFPKNDGSRVYFGKIENHDLDQIQSIDGNIFMTNNYEKDSASKQIQNFAFLPALAFFLSSDSVNAAASDYGILAGRTASMLHPVTNLALFATTIYSGYLGLQWRRLRDLGEELKTLNTELPTLSSGKAKAPFSPLIKQLKDDIVSLKQSSMDDSLAKIKTYENDLSLLNSAKDIEAKIVEITETRKTLLGENLKDKHFTTGSTLLGVGVTVSILGAFNTFMRSGKLYPGPHLYAGMAITILWAVAAALVPSMQKGNEGARIAHIGLNGINVALFGWQVITGLDIMVKVWENTSCANTISLIIVMATEYEKNTLLTEIEESLSSSHSKPKLEQEDVMQLYSDRDNRISQEAIQIAISHGIDPRFILSSKAKLQPSEIKSTKASDDSFLEPHLEYFISGLENLDLVDLIYGNDDGDIENISSIARERILNTKLPKSSFEPLLDSIKTSNPILHRTLLQLPIVSGLQKQKKKATRKERKKDKRDKEYLRSEKEKYAQSYSKNRLLKKERKDKSSGLSFDTQHDDRTEQKSGDFDAKKHNELLGIVVAKSIAENSMSSYLLTVALLLLENKTQDSNISQSQVLTGLPVANVIACLFEPSKPNAIDQNQESSFIPNPYHAFISTRQLRSKSISNSDISKYDGGSQFDENHDTISQSGSGYHGGYHGGAHSDAGSTIGSTIGSTLAEIGTETASVLGDEITEEELLAQALALSMSDNMQASNNLNSSTQTFMRSVSMDNSHNSASPNVSEVLNSSLINKSSVTILANETAPSLFSESVSSSNSEGVSNRVFSIPDKLPQLSCMTTLGPFCCKDVWSDIMLQQQSVEQSNTQNSVLSIRQIVIALLVVTGLSADRVINTKPSEFNDNDSHDEKLMSEALGSIAISNNTPEIVPTHVTFFLIEYLLDFLIKELVTHLQNYSIKQAAEMDMKQNRSPIFATNPLNDFLSEEEFSRIAFASVEWHYHYYFLVWSMVTILKILHANLQIAVSSKLAIGALGLINVLDKIDSNSFSVTLDESATSIYDENNIPFVVKLMHKLCEFCQFECDIMGGVGSCKHSVSEITRSALPYSKVISNAYLHDVSKYSSILECEVEPVVDTNVVNSPAVKLNFKHTNFSYSHYLRLAAINSFMAGLTIFHPNPKKRLLLLTSMIEHSPTMASSQLYEFQSTPLYLHDYVMNKTKNESNAQSDDKFDDYYKLFLLQKACLRVFLCDEGLSGVITTVISSVAELRQVSGVLAESNGTSTDQLNVLDTFYDATISSIIGALQSILTARLLCDPLLVYKKPNEFENQAIDSSDNYNYIPKSMFWGELILLRCIQKMRLDHFSTSINTSGAPYINYSSYLSLNTLKCHPNLNISQDGNIVSHHGPKLWATVNSVGGFEPNSGVYEWVVRIDKCCKGHVFIGIVTNEASTDKDSYVGVDRHGWGLIGTRSLWHNKSKVVADYGAGFTTGSLIIVKLDTYKGSLSFRSPDQDWGTAFDNLPKQKIYPSYSLHEREDQISVLFCYKLNEIEIDSASVARGNTQSSKVLITDNDPANSSTYDLGDLIPIKPKSKLRENAKAEKEFEAEQSLIRYFCILFYHANNLLRQVEEELRKIEDNIDIVKCVRMLSHPIIGTLVPSIAAYFSAGSFPECSIRFSSFHFNPYFMLISRRLAYIYDAINAKKLDPVHRNASFSTDPLNSQFDYTRLIEGDWLLRNSAIPGSNIGAQEYCLTLNKENHPKDVNSVRGHDFELGEISDDWKFSNQATIIAGHGTSEGANVTIQGTQYGNRIKFIENWNKSSSCVIEGRLSFCGTLFTGKYKDMKTGKMGYIDGYRLDLIPQQLSVSFVTNVIMKSAILCNLAASNLSAHLVVGSQTKTLGETRNLNPDRNDYDNQIDDDEENMNTRLQQTNLVNHWIKSDLFSNGLRLSDKLISYLYNRICKSILPLSVQPYSSPLPVTASANSEDAEVADSSLNQSLIQPLDLDGLDENIASTCTEVLFWWLSVLFPTLRDKILNLKISFKNPNSPPVVSVATHADESISSEEHIFYANLRAGKESGQILDEYMSLHAGSPLLIKIGGDVMRHARRLVLIAIIKHSGCYPLCVAEVRSVVNAGKLKSDRPNEVLLEVWRAAQRVIERYIRLKQENGTSYSIISQSLCSKAELLIELEPNKVCFGLTESLTFDNEQQELSAIDPGESAISVSDARASLEPDCSKLIAEIVEFLICPLQSGTQLRAEMMKMSYLASLRSAGFQSFNLIVNKIENADDFTTEVGVLPPIVNISLQSVCISSIFSSFRDMNIFDSSNIAEILNSVSPPRAGHYLDNIHSVPPELIHHLKLSFESIFNYITQFLARCTWSGNRSGQIVALAAWGIIVKPDDHSFLNQIGIFRVLQTVLDDARSSISKLQQKYPNDLNISIGASDFSNVELEYAVKFQDHPLGVFACEMLMSSHKRLAQLVLCIVHGLASQVATAKESVTAVIYPSQAAAPKLQKSRSGPDTLSKSLFELMYSELFTAVKGLVAFNELKIQQLQKGFEVEDDNFDMNDGGSDYADGNSSKVGNAELSAGRLSPVNQSAQDLSSTSAESFLEGESYIYRILRLLYLVSNSKNSLQRRTLKLIRRLLINSDPTELFVYVPTLFGSRDEVFFYSDGVLDDDEFKNLALVQDTHTLNMDGDGNGDYESPSRIMNSSQRIVQFFLEGVASNMPYFDDCSSTSTSSIRRLAFVSLLNQKGTLNALSADSLVVLRVLQGVPAWRKIIDDEIVLQSQPLETFDSFSDATNGQLRDLYRIISALSINGGYTDRIRIGGLVTLKPQSLLGSVDNFASKLAAASHSCGILVQISQSTSTAEVVLMDRGIKSLSGKKVEDPSSANYIESCTIQHTNLPGVYPIRAYRVNISDVLSCTDIPVIPSFVSMDLFNSLVRLMNDIAVPWLTKEIALTKPTLGESKSENKTDSDGSNEDAPSVERNFKVLEMLLSMYTLKSVSIAVQEESNSSQLLDDANAALWGEMLFMAAQHTELGNLSVIESLEERFSKLWVSYFEITMKPVNEKRSEGSLLKSVKSTESLNKDLEPNKLLSSSRAESSGISMSPLREISAILSPFGPGGLRAGAPPIDPNVQAAALAQMLEIGLPKEWCEFALRRCHFNVEMAINMCLEHGSEMSQLIAEDALYNSAQSAREGLVRRQLTRDMLANSSVSGSGPSFSSTQRMNLLRATIGGLSAERGSIFGSRESAPPASGAARSASDSHALIRQLLEMGFPPSWCARALESSNASDVDSALGWILTHDEELLGYPSEEPAPLKSETVEDIKDDVKVDEVNEESIKLPVNPLSNISGNCEINKSNLQCSTPVGGFPSVGCRGFAATSGKWYYELTLLTAGCVQVGWVNTAFEGGAEAGQGVGDDIHSWAYDGWRSYLWHESSADWGGRWTVDDVVGCAVDVDAGTMSFFLNGHGSEIQMGLAFTNLFSEVGMCGGVYPAVSFNRNEKVQFNFGSTPFKYPAPMEAGGYLPFLTHVLSNSLAIERDILLNNNSAKLTDFPSVHEDAFEEPLGEKSFPVYRRYFANESNQSDPNGANKTLIVTPENLNYFCASSIISKLPSSSDSIEKVVNELVLTAKNLSILYSRLAVLRTLCRSPSQLLYNSLILDKDNSMDLLHTLLTIVRMSCVYSNRTKSYLSIMSILPITYPTPQNLGSIFATGGFPMLSELKPAMNSLLEIALSNNNVDTTSTKSTLCSFMLDMMTAKLLESNHLIGSRQFASTWRVEGDKFAPISYKDGLLKDADALSIPSLPFSLWLTGILNENILSELNKLKGKISASDGRVSEFKNQIEFIFSVVEKVFQAWLTLLKTPSIIVKQCAMRILIFMIQELSVSSEDYFQDYLRNMMSLLFPNQQIFRFERHTLLKLNNERQNLPICSEYLQCLLEFVATVGGIGTIQNMKASSKPLKINKQQDDLGLSIAEIEINEPKCSIEDEVPVCEGDFDESNPDFSWEAVGGRLLTDNGGWNTWTGTVKFLKVSPPIQSAPTTTASSFRSRPAAAPTERHDLPQELLPGCKVARQMTRRRKEAVIASVSVDGTSDETSLMSQFLREYRLSSDEGADMLDSADSTASQHLSLRDRLLRESSTHSQGVTDPITRFKRIFDRANQDDSSSTKASEESLPLKSAEVVDQIGTVVRVTNWEGDLPGTARVVVWDNDETKAEETVRWGATSENGPPVYDVEHVLYKAGRIVTRHPNPLTKAQKLFAAGFGTETLCGVIFRVRKSPKSSSDEDDVKERLTAIIEWPDFSATVLASGFVWDDGRWILTEDRLLTGPSHCGWEVRFGTSFYQPGTSYTIETASSCLDRTDKYNRTLIGISTFTIHRNNAILSSFHSPFNHIGELSLQQQRLFYFDNKMHASNINLSADKLAVSKSGGSGQCCALGSIGFSSGVHYWEFKIEQAELGSIFIGVTEKPSDVKNHKYTRWMGSGFINNRTSYRAATSHSLSEKVSVYGDQFQTGDIVGVMLDMNRGRLLFFLDGLKYGEHTIADLGEAYDNLSNGLSVKPKTLYPIVGLSKGMDRVALTSRWLSSVGAHPQEELVLYRKAWSLLSSWSIERPVQLSSEPFQNHLWIYRDAWRHWLQWRSNKHMRVRTRCKSSAMSMPLLLDTSHRSCVEASIRLGLGNALFSGDYVAFTKSSGRALGTKEEAVILGAYNGCLWYRYDAQFNNTGSSCLLDSPSLAWCLLPNDTEGMTLIRRRPFEFSQLRKEIVDLPLPRIPTFQGGLIYLFHESGAVVRDGLEIDHSDVLCTIPTSTTIYAVEKRMNSSNIFRYRVLYEGNYGWISEKMRGGTEEVMLSKVSNATPEQKEVALAQLVIDAATIGITDRLRWHDVSTLDEAMACWGSLVEEIGFRDMLRDGGILSSSPVEDCFIQQNMNAYYSGNMKKISVANHIKSGSKYFEDKLYSEYEPGESMEDKKYGSVDEFSKSATPFYNNKIDFDGKFELSFQYFTSLAATIDRNGQQPWSVEADMQLVELISKCSAKEGVSPQNLSANILAKSVNTAIIDSPESYGSLIGCSQENIIARAAVLRVANLIFGYVLPYINLTLPEEKIKNDIIGSDCDIDFILTKLPLSPSGSDNNSTEQNYHSSRSSGSNPRISKIESNKLIGLLDETPGSSNKGYYPGGRSESYASWKPPCVARKLRSLRRLLFSQTKTQFWESILDATSTATSLPQDEYEDPKEIKSLRVNRVKATISRLSTIPVSSERLKQSVFGQMHKEMRAWTSASFRRSYVGKGHGGQKRAFKVKFIGEGVNDYGGPYRAVFEQVVDELQCDTVALGGRKPSERCLLPLLIPCPNRSSAVGLNQDKFLLSSSPVASPINQELVQFFGKVVGTAVRHHLNVALDLSLMLWRPLVKLPLMRAHLETVDVLVAKNLADVSALGLHLESELSKAKTSQSKEISNTSELSNPEEWTDLTFSIYLPDGSRTPLIPNGSEIGVDLSNWRDYVALVEAVRLTESLPMFKVFREGLASTLPVELFPLFTAHELEHLVSGDSVVEINTIRQSAEYEDNLDPNSELVRNFWEVLSELSNDEKTLFLKFVWARSRMPTSAQDLPMNFKLQSSSHSNSTTTNGTNSSDQFLPQAQTCFFSLSLPSYSSKAIMREKLLYAIKNSPNMDADVRLHSAEGWTDS
eukprot:gene4035-5772_t